MRIIACWDWCLRVAFTPLRSEIQGQGRSRKLAGDRELPHGAVQLARVRLPREGQRGLPLTRARAPTPKLFHVFWFTTESAPRLSDDIIIICFCLRRCVLVCD